MPLKKGESPKQIASHATTRDLKPGTERRVRETVVDFGNRAVAAAGDETYVFDVLSRPTRQFLTEFGAERIEDINRTTQRKVVAQIKQGVRRGESLPQIRNRLRPWFSKGRAMRIARTEVTRASNFAAMEGFAQAGIPGKEWVTQRDGHVRDTHEFLDGEQHRLPTYFVTFNGDQALYPGDFGIASEDVNCRCGLLPVFEWRGRSERRRAAAWKELERLRKPHVRMLARTFRRNLGVQQARVFAALEEAWEAA